MKAPSARAAPKLRWKRTSRTTAEIAAAAAPRTAELAQVGGVSTFGPRLVLVRCRACAWASARLRGRAARRLASIRPPWVPRRLRRRFLLVCATSLNATEFAFMDAYAPITTKSVAGIERRLDHLPRRIEVADRDVRRESSHSGLGHEAHHLGFDRAGAKRSCQLADALDDLRQRHGEGIVDVGRDLDTAAGERQADRPHAAQSPTRLAQAGGHGTGDLGVAAVQLDVEGGKRWARGDKRHPSGPVRLGGAVVGAQLAALHPQPELGQAAVAEIGALGMLGATRQRAVHE